MIFKIILTILLSMSIGVRIGSVGKTPDETTAGSALLTFAINGAVIFGLWYWL